MPRWVWSTLLALLLVLGFCLSVLTSGSSHAPDVRPPAVQPGPPVVTPDAGQR